MYVLKQLSFYKTIKYYVILYSPWDYTWKELEPTVQINPMARVKSRQGYSCARDLSRFVTCTDLRNPWKSWNTMGCVAWSGPATLYVGVCSPMVLLSLASKAAAAALPPLSQTEQSRYQTSALIGEMDCPFRGRFRLFVCLIVCVLLLFSQESPKEISSQMLCHI